MGNEQPLLRRPPGPVTYNCARTGPPRGTSPKLPGHSRGISSPVDRLPVNVRKQHNGLGRRILRGVERRGSQGQRRTRHPEERKEQMA